jgi:hypothetical protein
MEYITGSDPQCLPSCNIIYAPSSTPEGRAFAASTSAASSEASLAPLLGASEGSVEAVKLVDGPLVAEPVTEASC